MNRFYAAVHVYGDTGATNVLLYCALDDLRQIEIFYVGQDQRQGDGADF